MLCYRLEGCNVDPVVGLLFVICLFVVIALLLGRDKMGGMFRGAVESLLNILVNRLKDDKDKGNDDKAP